MELNPLDLAQRDRYKILIGAIVPRPIAFVSTVSPEGKPNLAPFSFFAGVASEPMSLLFCPANKPDGTEKDTLRNIDAGSDDLGMHGEFVVNIVSHAIARQMAACAEELPYGESEFGLSGLTETASSVVKPPRVKESLISFESRSIGIIRLAPRVPGGGNIVIGRVVHVHVDDRVIDERHHIDPAVLDALGRMGGLGYCTTRDRLEIPMGRAALADRPGSGGM